MQQKIEDIYRLLNPTPIFPFEELNTWLKGRKHWDHQDWLNLLADLNKKGYGKFMDSKADRDGIGKYLEFYREK